jgi:hypothetical protein
LTIPTYPPSNDTLVGHIPLCCRTRLGFVFNVAFLQKSVSSYSNNVRAPTAA